MKSSSHSDNHIQFRHCLEYPFWKIKTTDCFFFGVSLKTISSNSSLRIALNQHGRKWVRILQISSSFWALWSPCNCWQWPVRDNYSHFDAFTYNASVRQANTACAYRLVIQRELRLCNRKWACNREAQSLFTFLTWWCRARAKIKDKEIFFNEAERMEKRVRECASGAQLHGHGAQEMTAILRFTIQKIHEILYIGFYWYNWPDFPIFSMWKNSCHQWLW